MSIAGLKNVRVKPLTVEVEVVEKADEGRGSVDAMMSDVRELTLPVHTMAEVTGKLRQLHLYVSTDGGETWSRAMSIAPSAKAFSFSAPKDGAYWFAVQLEYLDGRTEPECIRRPDLKVIVDTGESSSK